MTGFLILLFLSGWKIGVTEIATSGHDTARTEEEVLLEGLEVKVTGPDESFIVDMERDKIITVLKNQEIYSETELIEWAKMMNRIREAMALPTPKKIEVRERGKGPLIAGHKTTRYDVFLDGEKTQTIFVADDLVAPEFDQFEKALLKISYGKSFVREMITDSLKKLTKGLALKAVSEEKGIKYISEIESLVKQKIPEKYFLPPRGYKKVSLDEFFKRMALEGKRKSP